MKTMQGTQRDLTDAKGTRYTKKANNFIGMKSKTKWFAMDRKTDTLWMCLYGSEALGGSYSFVVAQTEGPPATAIQVYQMAKEIIEDILTENKTPNRVNREGHSLH